MYPAHKSSTVSNLPSSESGDDVSSTETGLGDAGYEADPPDGPEEGAGPNNIPSSEGQRGIRPVDSYMQKHGVRGQSQRLHFYR